MDMNNDFNISVFQSIGLISIVLAFYFSFHLFSIKSHNKSANKLLAFFFLIFTILQLFLFSSSVGLNKFAYVLLVVFVPVSLSIGPTSYLYLKALLNQEIKIKKHFIVSAIFLTINLICFSLLFPLKKTPYANIIIDALIYTNVIGFSILFITQSVAYIALCFKLLSKHKENIKNIFSYTSSQISLSWIKVFILGYMFFSILVVLLHFLPKNINSFLIDLLILIYLLYIGYNGSKQSNIFFGFEKIEPINEEIINDPTPNQEVFSETKTEEIKINPELKNNLLEVIEKEKVYLNPELSIIDLSKKLNSNQKYLSYLINNEFHKTFIHFINEYRVIAAEKLMHLPENQNLKIEAYGYMAGFNSKSAFYNAFKKYYNETPANYYKNIKF